MSKGTSGSSGIGVLGLLGVAFVVLKLTNYIDWSWWYVTLPFWIGVPIIGLVLFVWLIIQYRTKKRIERKYRK